jgi:hypothetical protein
MKIILTNNLLIDLFRDNRSAALRICSTATSLHRPEDPDALMQLVLHADQIGQLEFRLKVLLEDRGCLYPCPSQREGS